MKRLKSTFLFSTLVLVMGTVLIGACTSDDQSKANDTAKDVQQQAKNTGTDLKAQSKDAWASMRTDGSRLVDRIQTANDPQAKTDLLSRCRDSVENLRKAGSDRAETVNSLCDRIRDTDVSNSSDWNAVRDQLKQLNQELGG